VPTFLQTSDRNGPSSAFSRELHEKRRAAAPRPAPAVPRRAGFSLLEVLISIFVILVGLLGIVAIIPVGNLAMVQATRADRTGTSGRGALREVQIRRMLDSSTWRHARNGLPVEFDTATGIAVLDNRASFCIDPLYIARNCQWSGGYVVPNDIYKFPYTAADTDGDPSFNGAPAEQCWMPRVTLQWWTGTPAPSVQESLFDRVFTWRDDKLFPIPDDRENRPQALYDATDFPLFEGKCSWMATVMPMPRAPDLPAATGLFHANPFPAFNAANRRLYEVSVVVFYNKTGRDFASPANADPDQPAERIAVASVLGNGIGGGDVELKLVDPATPATYLNVKAGDWLMLCGRNSPITMTNVHKWYKVVAVDEVDPSNPRSRYVTLAGPDWNTAWCLDLDGDTTYPDAQAVLVNGVSGVYTQTIELD
jgi:type II secretory pathway pseudopilin PulG